MIIDPDFFDLMEIDIIEGRNFSWNRESEMTHRSKFGSNGILGFGSDHEDARGIDHPPAIAGAYFAAKLGVLEYLSEKKTQSGKKTD